MSKATCRCGKELSNGTTICTKGDKNCRRTLDVALGHVAAYHDDLETVRTRQTRYGSGTSSKGSIGKTMPLGMDLAFDIDGAATRAYDNTRAMVRKWGKTAMLEWPATEENPHPADTVRSVLAYLQRNLHRIVGTPWAPKMMTDVLSCERALLRIVDRPADGWYAGICGHTIEPDRTHDQGSCGCACHTYAGECDLPGGGCSPEIGVIPGITCTRVLYAQPDKPHVTCPNCGTRHNVEARRDQLLKEAEVRYVTVRMLARIVTTLGATDASEAKLEGRINVWVHRGKLRAGGERVVDGRRRPVYRVGDVLDLLAADSATRSAS